MIRIGIIKKKENIIKNINDEINDNNDNENIIKGKKYLSWI